MILSDPQYIFADIRKAWDFEYFLDSILHQNPAYINIIVTIFSSLFNIFLQESTPGHSYIMLLSNSRIRIDQRSFLYYPFTRRSARI